MTYECRTIIDERQILAAVADRAPAVDQGDTAIGDDLAQLRAGGVMADLTSACLPGGDWRRGFDLLHRIGGASLSVGRLVEGHANAARLIALYGTVQQRGQYLSANQMLGVWGADGANPLRIASRPDAEGQVTLSGGKSFCSGLGLVTTAIAAAPTDDGPQLLIVDATRKTRQHAASWEVSGMRATASGDYDMDGLTASLLGRPGDQVIEPHFEGGIWRYLAVHSGALAALSDAATAWLHKRGAPDLQKARLARLAICAGTARLWSAHAARAAEDDPADAGAVPTVLLAREAVEAACQEGIALTERLFGTAAFRTGSRVDLIRRDLAFFLRQAHLDGKLLRAADGVMQAGAENAPA